MEHKQKITLISIILIATLSQIATDMYSPSLPAIAYHFHVSLGQSQGTMSAFLLGIALTTLLYGPLSEGIGRRKTVITGMLIALVGTTLCMFATSIHMLYIGRLIQGLGLGACTSLWRSIFRDTFSGDALARIGSILVVALTGSAILAPFAGGLIQQYFGWRMNFIILFAWMILVFIKVFFFFAESSQHHGMHRLNLPFAKSAYWSLLKDRLFMGYCFISLLSYGGLFSWLTAGPMILIHGLHVQPSHFGSLIVLTGLSTGISGVIGGKLVKALSPLKILVLGLLLMIAAGALLLGLDATIGLNVVNIMIAAMLFVFGSTFVFLNCFALGFKQVGKIAGYAGSLYACIQQMGGFIFTGLLGFISSSHAAPMAWMFVISGITSFAVYFLLIKPAQKS